MSESLFLAAVFLLLIGSVGFYLYSKIAYADRKMNYLESVLIDLRLSMDMEKKRRSAPEPMPVKESQPMDLEDSENVEDDKNFYASVIESAAVDTPAESSEEETLVPQDATNAVPSPDYEAMTRDEVAAVAEKKSLRVTKRMNKAAIVSLLRETEKNTSTMTESGKDGAPLSMEAVSLPLANDSLSA